MEKIPQGRAKLMFDISIMGIVLFVAIIRNLALAMEYLDSLTDKESQQFFSRGDYPVYAYNTMYPY